MITNYTTCPRCQSPFPFELSAQPTPPPAQTTTPATHPSPRTRRITHEDHSFDSHLIPLSNYQVTKRDPVARWYPGSAMYPCQPLPHGSHLYIPIGAVRSHTPVHPRLNAGHRGIPRPPVRDGIEINTSHLSEPWNSCLGHPSQVDHKDCNEVFFISRLSPPMTPKRCRSQRFESGVSNVQDAILYLGIVYLALPG